MPLIIERIEESCEDTRACKWCLMQQDMQIYLDCESSDSVVRRCIRCVHALLRYPENLRVTRLSAELDDNVQWLALVCRYCLTRRKNHGSPCNENKQANRLTFVESGRGYPSSTAIINLPFVATVGAFCAFAKSFVPY